VVGISQYLEPAYELSYAREDAQSMASILRDEYGFEIIAELYDGEATKLNIQKYFEHDIVFPLSIQTMHNE